MIQWRKKYEQLKHNLETVKYLWVPEWYHTNTFLKSSWWLVPCFVAPLRRGAWNSLWRSIPAHARLLQQHMREEIHGQFSHFWVVLTWFLYSVLYTPMKWLLLLLSTATQESTKALLIKNNKAIVTESYLKEHSRKSYLYVELWRSNKI